MQKGNDGCFWRKANFDLAFAVCRQPIVLTKRSPNKGHHVSSLSRKRFVLTLKNSKQEFNIIKRVAQLWKKRHLEGFVDCNMNLIYFRGFEITAELSAGASEHVFDCS